MASTSKPPAVYRGASKGLCLSYGGRLKKTRMLLSVNFFARRKKKHCYVAQIPMNIHGGDSRCSRAGAGAAELSHSFPIFQSRKKSLCHTSTPDKHDCFPLDNSSHDYNWFISVIGTRDTATLVVVQPVMQWVLDPPHLKIYTCARKADLHTWTHEEERTWLSHFGGKNWNVCGQGSLQLNGYTPCSCFAPKPCMPSTAINPKPLKL